MRVRVGASFAAAAVAGLCFFVPATSAISATLGRMQGTVTHVTDGDTLWVRPARGGEAVAIRLDGIDAPEICQRFGPESRDALAGLALRRQVLVTSRARDRYHRVIAEVQVGNDDVGAWLVRRGYAWAYRFHGHSGRYRALEAQAQAEHRGLWASAITEEPRDFRRRHGSCHTPSRRH